MSQYTIEYQAGTYRGERTVEADDAEEAVRKVRASIRREMSLPMYYEHYRIKP